MKGLARDQVLISSLLLGIAAATWTGVASLSNSEGVSTWIRDERIKHWRRTNGMIADVGTFRYPGDHAMLQEIEVDHSEGGVYYFGTSSLAMALHPWEFPYEHASMVRNFSIAGAQQTDQLNIVRYLIDYKGFLSRGSDTLVVLALYFENANRQEGARFWKIFPNLIERSHLYNYDRESGLHPRSFLPFERFVLLQRARSRSFLRMLQRSIRLTKKDGSYVRPQFDTSQTYSPDFLKHTFKDLMGPDWENGLKIETRAFDELLRLLTENRAHVIGVLLPIPSWFREQPYTERYRVMTTELFEQHGVELIDLTNLLDDDEFADHAHISYTGTRKTSPILREIGAKFLDGRARNE